MFASKVTGAAEVIARGRQTQEPDVEARSAIFAVCLEAAVFMEMKTGISVDDTCGLAVSC
jgi:hypothetical protein